jgi:hypothetical protein
MDITYKGWIPTVLGNLSFAIIGHSGYPFKFYTSVNEDRQKGILEILCMQKRIPPDYQIPLFIPIPNSWYLELSSWVARKFFDENIESIYLLSCKGLQDNDTWTVQKLTGKVYRFCETSRIEQKRRFNKLCEDITKKRFVDYEDCFFYCDVEVDRQGICTLKWPDDKKTTDKFEKDDRKNIINQCFYFVKDSFHSHKHHSQEEDTLVSAHIDSDNYGFTWAEQILRDLYRYVIRQRLVAEKKTLGIFCYIRTFIELKKKNKLAVSKIDSLFERTISLDELEKSISISIEEKEQKITFKRWFLGISLAVFQLTLFYFLSAYNDEFKQFIRDYSTQIIVGVISLLMAILNYTENTTTHYWKNSIRLTNLLIAWLSKKSLIIFLFSVSLVAFVIGAIFLAI